jgi:integrase/recombinase XerD
MPTLARTAREFLDDPALSTRTRKLYEGILSFFTDIHRNREVKEITRIDVEEYLKSLTHLNYRTHNLHQTVINRLFNFAAEKRYVDSNPLQYIKRRKPAANKGEHQDDEPVKYLSKKQVILLLKAVSYDKRLLALVYMLYESGARIAEVLSLKKSSIDFQNRQFQVIGKGNKKRWCFFGEKTAEALKNYINGNREHPHDALFTERKRKKGICTLSYNTAYRTFSKAVREYSSLQGVAFHDLRHTFATERANLISLEVLRALLGHEKIQTTLIYQKVTSKVAREEAHAVLEKINNN